HAHLSDVLHNLPNVKSSVVSLFFFCSGSPPPAIYTPSLHDALPILVHDDDDIVVVDKPAGVAAHPSVGWEGPTVLGALASHGRRSEEHTSELQSRENLVCRLLLEKKKNYQTSLRSTLICEITTKDIS